MNAQEKLAVLDLELELQKIKDLGSHDAEKIHGDLDSVVEDFVKTIAPNAANLIEQIKFNAKWWTTA